MNGSMRHHGAESAPSSSESGVRAKALDKAARKVSATRFAHAVEAIGSSLAAVARSWGIDAAIVGEIRDGLRPLTWERINALPRSVEVALLEARLAELRETAPVSRRAPTHYVIRAVAKVGELAVAVEDAGADGFIDHAELVEIERLSLATCEVLQASARDARLGRTG